MNTNRTNGKHSALVARARRRFSGRHSHHQSSEGARQAEAGDVPTRGTQNEYAAKVWSVIAKHRDVRRALEAAADAAGETDEAKDHCVDAGKDVFPR